MTVKLIKLDVLVAGVVLKMLLVMGIRNGILRVLLQRKPVRVEEMVLQRRPLRVEGMVFVGSKLMIVVDFVLIKKGVIFGNIVFYFCGVGRRLECCMRNRGKLFCLILLQD